MLRLLFLSFLLSTKSKLSQILDPYSRTSITKHNVPLSPRRRLTPAIYRRHIIPTRRLSGSSIRMQRAGYHLASLWYIRNGGGVCALCPFLLILNCLLPREKKRKKKEKKRVVEPVRPHLSYTCLALPCLPST